MKIRIDMPNSTKRDELFRAFRRDADFKGPDHAFTKQLKVNLDEFDTAEAERILPNSEKIEAALAAVNGNATAHTITAAREVRALIARAEAMLDDAGLTSSFRKGAKLHASGSGPSAKSYKYKVKTTMLHFERGGTAWFLTGVETSEAYPREREHFALVVDQDQAETIRKAAIAPFVVAA